MSLWLAILGALALAAGVGAIAVSRHYRVPQVRHQSDPGALGIPFEEIRFPTARGKSLYGWWIPRGRPDAPTVILVHGWARNVDRVLPYVRILHSEKCGMLAFDARSHGSSDADGYANMVKFSEDIRAAVDEAVHRGADPERLAVLGYSIGGAAAIHAAARDARIGSVVAVGAFANPADIMRLELRKRGAPRFLVSLILLWVEHKVGFRLNDVAPERQIGLVRAPVLLIHGEADRVVPVEQAYRLAAAGGPNVTLRTLPGRSHSNCEQDPWFSNGVRRFTCFGFEKGMARK